MAIKLPPLDQEIWDAWEELCEHRPDGGDDFHKRTLDLLPAWDALLDRAHDQTGWKIGTFVASVVAEGRWWTFMILRRYPEAEQEMQRWFSHPESARDDLVTLTEFEIRMLVARLAQGKDQQSALQLCHLVESGPRTPGPMANWVYHNLIGFLEDLPDESIPSLELKDLVVAIAKAKRSGKRLLKSCAECKTMRELRQNLAHSMGF